jgi:glycosyltransferase involved in cell wall biosynthesis
MHETGAMRICLVISSLSAGGAERVLSVMASYWAGKGDGVTLMTLDSVASDFYVVDPRVTRVGLDLMRPSPHLLAGVLNNMRRLWVLRQAIRDVEPDVLISFMAETNVLVLLASRGLEPSVIVSERVDPSRHSIGTVWSWLRRWLYHRADRVVVQSEQVRDWFSASVGRDQLTIIPNPVNVTHEFDVGRALVDVTGHQPNQPTVIGMGRLTNQKGFDLLLQAFAAAVRELPEWQLILLGDGEERAALEGLAERLGLKGKVFLPGCVQNPQALLRQADLFVLSSRYEGFPNVLLEAMACALPAISFDCRSGPGEIIRDGVDGLLVPAEDVAALASTMTRLMGDPEQRARLAAQAVRVTDRFGMERVMALWDEVIKAVVGADRRGEMDG